MGKKELKRKAPENISLNASKQKEFNQKVHKIKQRKKPVGSSAGIVYVSHLPWGFEEKPLKKYFSQFGTIKQMRVSRSKKTGNTRGYAYIQFVNDEVAKIVAESMNNYLMFGKLIKCRHLTNPHTDTFKNAHRKFIKTPTFLEHAVVKHNSQKRKEAVEKSQSRILGKLTKLQATLAAKGITYTLDDENLQATKKKLKDKKKAKKEQRQKEKKENMNEEEPEEKDSEEEEIADVIDDDEDDDDDDDESSDDDLIEKEAVEVSDDYISGDDDEDNEDNDDDDGDDDEIEFTKTKSPPASKNGKGSKPGTPSGMPRSVEKKSLLKAVSGTPKRLSICPKEVDTPKGKMNVLIEDSSDEEITFRTPPMSIKSSKLDESMKIMTKTPKTQEDIHVSPKRKQKDKTAHTGAKKAKMSGEEEPTGKMSKVEVSPQIEVKSEVNNENLSPKGANLRKQSGTPMTVVKTPHQTPGRKTPKSNHKKVKTPPSQAKFKGLKK